jgi:hypothetical protein
MLTMRMCHCVSSPHAIQTTHKESFDHQIWPSKEVFRRSQGSLHGGVVRVSEVLLVWL